MSKEAAITWIDRHARLISETNRYIWENPELGLMETKSAARLADVLEEFGFTVRRGVAGMPTAFVASYSTGGGPVIGYLGEYDALAELSQADSPERRPLIAGGAGHGCGHNLLGTGAMAAAIATKAAMDAGRIKGTVCFYGCPAEETLVGKVFMVRDGLFEDCDAAITWHPAALNTTSAASSLAMNSAKFRFFGVTSHAAATPEMGRSALDAVELMNTGVNYLREHIIQEARIHYVITGGGLQPNVVPSFAEVWYYVRAPRRQDVDEIYARVQEIARGAALMAGVRHEESFLVGCYDILPNSALVEAAYKNMEAIGGPKFTDEEKAFARQLAATHPPGQREKSLRKAAVEIPDDVFLHEGVVSPKAEKSLGGSTDVGDVSWVTPTVEVRTATWPIGNAGHSWQNTAAAGTSIGDKGTVVAAKAMALTGIDLFLDSDLLARAKAEFRQKTEKNPYRTPLPAGAQPPFDQFE